MYSVDQVADLLGLHVRTVRGYIREGRLNAVRIGKQYRIARADLAAFTGQPVSAARARHAEMSTIVEIDGIGPEDAGRLGTLLSASLNPHREGDQPARLQTVHDRERDRMKIVVLGSLATGAALLRLIEMFLEAEQ